MRGSSQSPAALVASHEALVELSGDAHTADQKTLRQVQAKY